MLVGAALVSEGTQLSKVGLVLAGDVQHLILVVSVRDLVAVDAPELFAITVLVLARAHTAACRTKHKVERCV